MFTGASYESLRPEFRSQDPWGKPCRGPVHICNPSTKESRGRGSLGPVCSLLAGQCKLQVQQAALPPKEDGGKREDTGYSLLPAPAVCTDVVHSHLMHTHTCTHKVNFYKSLLKLKK